MFNNLILMVSNLNKYSLFKNEKNFPSYLRIVALLVFEWLLNIMEKYSIQYLASRAFITWEGVSMLGISDAVESIGSDIGCADHAAAAGKIVYKEAEFNSYWFSTKVNNEETGTALLLEPDPKFYEQEEVTEKQLQYLRYRPKIIIE